MALKTFNLDEGAYKEFSKHCKKHGISMSKRVENFIMEELARFNNSKAFVKNVSVNDKNSKVKVEKQQIGVEKHSFSKYC